MTQTIEYGEPPAQVGLIGAGKWGQNIARTLHQLGALGAIVETSAERRQQLKLLYPGVKICASCASVFSDPGIPAVAIATPAPTHHPLGIQAIGAGKDVFVEKPMALSSNDAAELVQAAIDGSRVLMVGHLLLYQPAVQFLKRYVDEGRLGQLYSVHQERVKLGRARYVENVTWSLGVHDVAVLLYLVGETPRVLTASGHCGLNEKVEDDVYLHMDFVSGVKAHLHNSWLWPENRRFLTMVGENGMLVYEEAAGRVSLHHKTVDRSTLEARDGGQEIVFESDSSRQPLEIELSHFLACVNSRERPISGGAEGLAVVTALERVLML